MLSGKLAAQRNSYACFSDQSIYKMDVLLCDTQLIGISSVFLTDIALTPSGNLYGTDFYNLYKVDTLNAGLTNISEIDTMGYGFNSLVALNDDYLLGVRVNSEIYKIDAHTGAKLLVGACGYFPAGDITFYKGYFFITDVINHLIRIKLNDNCTSIISSLDVGVMNTLYKSVYGILTVGNVSCSQDNLKLFAFEGSQVYEVNPNDGFCSLYCDSISIYSASGATSLTEVAFQGYDGLLDMPNIFTPNEDGVNDFLTPPKFYGISNIHIEIFNRWGNSIYSSNQDELKWDGKNKNGIPCSAGVYYYLINYINYCNEEFSTKGFVQLVR